MYFKHVNELNMFNSLKSFKMSAHITVYTYGTCQCWHNSQNKMHQQGTIKYIKKKA